MIKEDVHRLYRQQLNEWNLAGSNHLALKHVKIKSIILDTCLYKVQFNPARIVSSAAKIDGKPVREQDCFLCPDNRPAEQKEVLFKEHYSILVNPYPIFPYHLTIPDRDHTPQRILNRFGDMLDLAKELDDCIIFYNGPKAGASAPGHFHFQAGNKGFLPIEKTQMNRPAAPIAVYRRATIGCLEEYPRAILLIKSDSKEDASVAFQAVYGSMQMEPDDDEPMMNIITWYEKGQWIVCLFLREAHRPSCYFIEGEENFLISPGAVDMGGILITPLEKDYNKITADDIYRILQEVSIRPAALHQLNKQIKERL